MNSIYENARALLNGRESEKIDNNTYARLDVTDVDNAQPSVVIKLHATDIVTVMADGTITLDSGGWRTPTTKDRMNNILRKVGCDYQVSQDKSIWYISKDWRGAQYVYADDMTIKDDVLDGVGNVADNTARLKQIKKYVDGYMSALFTNELNAPSTGDCWYCAMRTEDGKTLGDVTNNNHILSHLDEMYFAPSLLVNASEMYGISIVAKDVIARLWQGETTDGWSKDWAQRQIKPSLTRYLKHHAGLPT